jgi:non-ribosomal peptide synthetase component F
MAEWLLREKISIGLVPLRYSAAFASCGATSAFPIFVLRLTSESVYKTDVDLYKKHFSRHCIFINGLNATEMGPVTACSLDHDTILTDNDVPVGYALPGIAVLLLDETGRKVGLNELGEIAIRSRYLARGYWRNPDLTNAKFSPDTQGRRGDLPDG